MSSARPVKPLLAAQAWASCFWTKLGMKALNKIAMGVYEILLESFVVLFENNSAEKLCPQPRLSPFPSRPG